VALLMIYTRVRSVSESCKILSLTSKSRVGILWDPDDPAAAIAFNEYEAVAFPLKVQLHSLKVRGPKPDIGRISSCDQGTVRRAHHCKELSP
jgi:hypothetical protein